MMQKVRELISAFLGFTGLFHFSFSDQQHCDKKRLRIDIRNTLSIWKDIGEVDYVAVIV